MIGIYRIVSPSNKVYIGQSWDIHARWLRYKSVGAPKQHALHNSFKKYGIAAHKFEVVHELPMDIEQIVLDTYEQLYMDAYRDCGIVLMNCKEGGANGKLSEETKRRIGDAQIGKKRSEETRAKLSASNSRRRFSDETKKKIGLANSGKKHTEERKKAVGDFFRGFKHTEERNKKLSEFWRGKTKTEEHNRKVSESRKQLGLAKGANNPKAKLTEDQVKEIRSTYIKGQSKPKEFCEKFGIGRTALFDIVSGRKWNHV